MYLGELLQCAALWGSTTGVTGHLFDMSRWSPKHGFAPPLHHRGCKASPILSQQLRDTILRGNEHRYGVEGLRWRFTQHVQVTNSSSLTIDGCSFWYLFERVGLKETTEGLSVCIQTDHRNLWFATSNTATGDACFCTKGPSRVHRKARREKQPITDLTAFLLPPYIY